jgi:hypothetical protein
MDYINGLPNELLADIFSLVPITCNNLNTNSHPWTLTRVSHRFRAVSLSSSKLWSTINLYSLPNRDLFPSQTKWRTYLHTIGYLVKKMLHRAGGHPLSVVIELDWDGIGERVFRPTLDLLISQSYRWMNAEIYSLCPSVRSTASYAVIFDALPNATQLRHLSLHILDQRLLHAFPLTPSDVLRALSSCRSNLRSLHLHYASTCPPFSFDDVEPVAMPVLASMSVDENTSSALAVWFLDRMCLPGLMELSVRGDEPGCESHGVEGAVKRLVDRSGSKLAEVDGGTGERGVYARGTDGAGEAVVHTGTGAACKAACPSPVWVVSGSKAAQ